MLSFSINRNLKTAVCLSPNARQKKDCFFCKNPKKFGLKNA